MGLRQNEKKKRKKKSRHVASIKEEHGRYKLEPSTSVSRSVLGSKPMYIVHSRVTFTRKLDGKFSLSFSHSGRAKI
jgi:hypothetical protein